DAAWAALPGLHGSCPPPPHHPSSASGAEPRDSGWCRTRSERIMTSTASLSARETARERRRTRTAELFAEASRATGERRKQLLDEVVVENMQVARSIASRYRGRGVAQEDLEQVAQAALVRC